jgi:hypothetical protein
MRPRRLPVAVALALAGVPAFAQPAAECPIPGDALHWVVDYCMATLQTDDEIPASDCIAAHPLGAFASACAAKLHFKRELCRLLQSPEAPPATIERCVADPAVIGSTVRNGGVGRPR